MKPTARKKRDLIREAYNAAAKTFLANHQLCFPCRRDPGRRVRRATQVHHQRGRLGPLLMDQRFWIPTCQECHDFIHNNIEAARRLGFICEKGDWNTPPKNGIAFQSGNGVMSTACETVRCSIRVPVGGQAYCASRRGCLATANGQAARQGFETMNDSFFRKSVPQIKERYPELWKACCPRRYIPPHGYANPNKNASWIASVAILAQLEPNLNDVQKNVTIVGLKLAECSCPTVFVGQEFIEALTMTDPPEDMRLENLQWPWDAVTFVLPDAFVMKFFGRYAPFVRIARQGYGWLKPPAALMPLVPVGVDIEKFEKDAFGVFIVSTEMDDDTGNGTHDYCTGHRMNTDVRTMLDCTNPNYKEFTKDGETKDFKPEDREFTRKFAAVAVHLMLALNVIPDNQELFTPESMARPAKIKRGVIVKEELWHPRILGKDYLLPKAHGPALGGTHASPRLHVRRGHWRQQRFGKQRSLIKPIWIRPMLVGVEQEAA